MNNKEAVLDLMASKDFELPQPYRDAYADEQNATYHTGDGGFDVKDMDQFVDEQTKLQVIPEGTNWHDYVDLVPLWRAQKALGLPLRPSPSDMAQ
jgi:hypothetical protein